MTAQIHEVLLLEGRKATLTRYPPLPDRHPRIVARDRREDEKAARSRDPFDRAIGGPGCRRGYIGIWEIRGGRIDLLALRGWYKLVGDGPIAAEWVSGVLSIPTGRRIHPRGDRYDRSVELRSVKGQVVDWRSVDLRERAWFFRRNPWNADLDALLRHIDEERPYCPPGLEALLPLAHEGTATGTMGHDVCPEDPR